MKLVIPEDEQFRIITACHITSVAHIGVDKTANRISDRYYWKGIYKDVRDFVRNCDSCQKVTKKQKTTKTEMEPIIVPATTWKRITIDLIGPYNDDNGKLLSDAGYRYILTVIDLYSNYTVAFPLFTKNASEIGENLFRTFCRHGFPLQRISDNGG